MWREQGENRLENVKGEKKVIKSMKGRKRQDI